MHFLTLLALALAMAASGPSPAPTSGKVSGRVELSTGGPLPKGCSVRLAAPAPAMPDRADTERRLAEAALRTQPNEQGFFQFEGVKAGVYALRAEHKDFAPAEEAPVVVSAGLETKLPAPLTLRPLSALTVQVDPPLDPYDRPWRLRLDRAVATGGGTRTGVADESGAWREPGLLPGAWHLSVLGENEGIWAYQTVEIEDADSFATIGVDVIAIEGSAFQGDEPFRGALWFGGARGPRRVRFDPDEDGKFLGLLPEEGEWEVQAENPGAGMNRLTLDPVEVRRRPGHSTARVEIQVPDTRLEGRVVDEAGRGVAAELLLIAERRPSLARSESDGRFLLRGLPEGVVSIQAETEDLASEAQLVSLEDGRSPPELAIVVRRRTRIQGIVRSGEGPLAGAEVFVWPAISQTAGGAPLTRAVSQPDGTFQASISGTPQTVDALTYALGYGFSLSRHSLPANGSLILNLDSASGHLEVQFPPGEKDIPQDLVLFHRGAFLPAVFLLRWGTFDAETGRLILPAAEAGEWTLCERFRPTEEPSGPGRCAQGTLFPGGHLALQSGSR